MENHGSAKGAFVRAAATFRNWIRKGHEKFQPEKDRYHLYISYACPWAHRTLIVRNLKGLEDVVGLSIVHPTWARTKPQYDWDRHCGWIFTSPGDEPRKSTEGFGSFDSEGVIPDTVNGVGTIRELYELAGSKSHGVAFSVPILWDKKLNTIVNNESSEIIQIFNSEFNEFAKNPDLNLAPEDLKESMKAVDEWIYSDINNGVYRCGFSRTQEAYEEAFDVLFDSLDKLEELLGRSRYVAGDKLTLSDIRAWVTLTRFDEVYTVYFKTNKRHIVSYPNILNFCREIYQVPGVADTLNMKHIKTHYYTSHAKLNHFAIIPKGANFEGELQKPHDRNRF